MKYIGKCKMTEPKTCQICGKPATHVCRWRDCTPRYMCKEHKHLLEEQGEYVCEEVVK